MDTAQHYEFGFSSQMERTSFHAHLTTAVVAALTDKVTLPLVKNASPGLASRGWQRAYAKRLAETSTLARKVSPHFETGAVVVYLL
jgi:hypothetical protein